MRKLVLVIGLLLLAQVSVFSADCPPGTGLEVIGSVAGGGSTDTGSTVVTITGHEVRASRVACGGTACTATLYDADGPNDSIYTADAQVKDEPGAAASTSTWTEYSPPLSFQYGIVAHDNGDVNGVLAYECR